MTTHRGIQRPRSPQAGGRGRFVNSIEAYLCVIFEWEEEAGEPPRRADVSDRTRTSRSAVGQVVLRLERDGRLRVSSQRRLVLTAAGRLIATRLVRKQRLVERLLVDVVDLERELVADEAARWRHVLSDHVERRLYTLLRRPTRSPFGLPIPGLDELAGSGRGRGRVRQGGPGREDGRDVTT